MSAELLRVAERALLARFEGDLGAAVSASHALAGRLAELLGPLTARTECVPGAGNLLLRFDESLAPGEVETARRRIAASLTSAAEDGLPVNPREHELTVAFGGARGEDLDAVASVVGLAPATVVERFCAATFRVAFVGFSPGFPYLIGLPPELELPRRASPRPRVPAGAVAVAGPFAGVYPSPTPGGWHLLGRAETRLFDPAADPPARLVAGDRVRFVAA